MIVNVNRELVPTGCVAVIIANEMSPAGGSRPNIEATVICGERSVTLHDEVGDYLKPLKDEFRTDCAIAMGAMCLGCPNNANRPSVAPAS